MYNRPVRQSAQKAVRSIQQYYTTHTVQEAQVVNAVTTLYQVENNKRPIRQSAQKATQRIREYYIEEDKENTELNNPYTDIMDDIRHIKNLLDNFENESRGFYYKLPIIINIFNSLSDKPDLIIRNVTFRNTVINKMAEFDKEFNTLISNYTDSSIPDYIYKLTTTTYVLNKHPDNYKFNQAISLLNEFHNEYNTYLQFSELKESIQKVRNTLEEIKSHPMYTF
jgi:hypothetical protein